MDRVMVDVAQGHACGSAGPDIAIGVYHHVIPRYRTKMLAAAQEIESGAIINHAAPPARVDNPVPVVA